MPAQRLAEWRWTGPFGTITMGISHQSKETYAFYLTLLKCIFNTFSNLFIRVNWWINLPKCDEEYHFNRATKVEHHLHKSTHFHNILTWCNQQVFAAPENGQRLAVACSYTRAQYLMCDLPGDSISHLEDDNVCAWIQIYIHTHAWMCTYTNTTHMYTTGTMWVQDVHGTSDCLKVCSLIEMTVKGT